MAKAKILDPASSWPNAAAKLITLCHGCTNDDRHAIEAGRNDPKRGHLHIDVRMGRIDADFGRGFYTTTVERQARHWAWDRFYHPKFARRTGNGPVVLVFEVKREELAKLLSLSFAFAGYNSENGYWSLVQYCRQSDPIRKPPLVRDHRGPVKEGANRWFDLCIGPVSAFWKQQVTMVDSDQVSFHTDNAAKILDTLIHSGSGYSHYVVT